jgi:hypothetical protein
MSLMDMLTGNSVTIRVGHLLAERKIRTAKVPTPRNASVMESIKSPLFLGLFVTYLVAGRRNR